MLTYRFNATDGSSTSTGDPVADKTVTVINIPPDTPVVATPVDGAIDVPQPIALYASDFVDTDAGDTHQASQWLVSTVSGDYSDPNLVHDSVTFARTFYYPSMSQTQGVTYYWKVRYQDQFGAWSDYSTEASFTLIDNAIPDEPAHISPVVDAVDVDRQLTLEAGPFSDSDGDTHIGSVWQVSTTYGDDFVYGIVHSNVGAAATSYVLPVTLDAGQIYYWRVRYQDDKGQWSDFTDTKFTTNSVVVMYHFDEGSGNVATDAVGNNNGSIRNGATWSTGFSGQGLLFDGVDDDVIWSYLDGTLADNFTIEAMVKATTTHEISAATDPEATSGTGGISGQKYLFGAQHPGGLINSGAGISMGTNGISVYEHGDTYMPPLAVYDPSTENPVEPQLGTAWNHVVATYTDKQPRIYLNGQLVHTGLTSLKTSVFAPIQLARGSYGAFAGTIDEVAIHGKSLTEAEVLKRCIAVGQCADGDIDSDGVTDSTDNCPFEANTDQADFDADGVGNVCEYLGYWKFDEGAGAITHDETVHNNDGQLFGGATWTAGKVSSAVDFDGSTGYVSIPDSPVHHFGSGSFTVETWINASSFTSTDNPAYVRWLSKSAWCASWSTEASCKWFVGQVDSTGHPQFSGRGYNDSSGFNYTAPGTISLNTWHHIAYVIDRSGTPGKGFIYIDGVNQSGTGVDLNALNGELNIPAALQLGGPYAELTGKLDQTAIYGNALSAAEILDHYQNP